jgi:fructose-1,6-bisphosphatase
MVADVHKTIHGGVFMYPADKKVRLACAFLFAAFLAYGQVGSDVAHVHSLVNINQR